MGRKQTVVVTVASYAVAGLLVNSAVSNAVVGLLVHLVMVACIGDFGGK
jgi:hypothetical protein